MTADEDVELRQLRDTIRTAIQQYELTTGLLVHSPLVLFRVQRPDWMVLTDVEVTSSPPPH